MMNPNTMIRKALRYAREDYPNMKCYSVIQCDYDCQRVTVEFTNLENAKGYIQYNF